MNSGIPLADTRLSDPLSMATARLALDTALQYACNLLDAARPLQKKLHMGLKSGQVKPAVGEHVIDAALEAGVLQPGEAQTLRDAEAARRKVIDVDDFDKEELALAQGKVR